MRAKTLPYRTPLFLSLAVFTVVVVSCAYFIEHNRLRNEVDREITRVEDLMASQLEDDIHLLNATLLAIGQSRTFEDALAARDREALLKEATPLFRGMRAEADITHFYFTGSDRVNILRLHKPDQFGDVIDRFTTVEAKRTGKPAQGLEIGPLGTLTMRVVYPQFRGDQCIGFIELGHDLGEHIELLGKTLDYDLRVLIKKKFLDQEGWSEGLKAFARAGDWNLLPDFVETGNQTGGFSEEVTLQLGTDHQEIRKGRFTSTVGGRPSRVAFLPVVGASGEDVGRLVIILDINDQQDAFVRFLLAVTIVSIAVAGLFGSLVTILMGRVSSHLQSANKA